MLELSNIDTYYGESHILHNISLSVNKGTCTTLLGRNGAGKTTTLRSIVGLTQARYGNISFRGQDITDLPPNRISRLGISYVPEHRGIFPTLSVEENLRVAAFGLRIWRSNNAIEDAFTTFPRLGARRTSLGSQLSGGEQQMLSIARALVGDPELLVLDEPSEGLAPVIVDQLEEVLQNLKKSGRTILLVEQNYDLAIRLADKVYVLNQGKVRFYGTPDELESNQQVKGTFLGLSSDDLGSNDTDHVKTLASSEETT
jgi:branched-chain amino acid transport system ATP-binding protein